MCLADPGVECTGNNAFGPEDALSRDYSFIIEQLAARAYDCFKNVKGAQASGGALEAPPSLRPFLDECGCTAADKAALAFALVLTNQYDW